MQHTIALETLGPNGESMAQAVDKCVHCGFCLSACPTYKVLGEEMDSPRGRIYLMKEVLEGTLDLDETLPYVDRCLGCMACVTACPSGVEYGHLLTPFRARAEEQRRRAGLDGVARSLVRNTLPYPARFRWAVRSGALARLVRPLLPEQIGAMVDLLPTKAPSSRPLPRQMAAQGPRRARVALLTGCVQQVLAPQINWATLRVLARNGVEVVVPPNQGCCGSLSLHIGEAAQAQQLARRNLAAFPADVDAVITNAAGCGSGMHEYPQLFAGQPDAAAAGEFAAKVQDVTTFLDALGLVTPPSLPDPLTVAYHGACHLEHAQGIVDEPRRLLRAIPNLALREVPEGDLCCGSAGVYNVEQPELAGEIGHRKAQNILATGATGVVTGNIGCMTQIKTHLMLLHQEMPVWHTVELLDMAYNAAQA